MSWENDAAGYLADRRDSRHAATSFPPVNKIAGAKVLAEEAKKAKPATKPAEAPKPEPTEQEKNFAALRAEVAKGLEKAAALQGLLAA